MLSRALEEQRTCEKRHDLRCDEVSSGREIDAAAACENRGSNGQKDYPCVVSLTAAGRTKVAHIERIGDLKIGELSEPVVQLGMARVVHAGRRSEVYRQGGHDLLPVSAMSPALRPESVTSAGEASSNVPWSKAPLSKPPVVPAWTPM